MQVNMAMAGAFAFGLIIGWYVYYVNRYRKGDVAFSDLTTLIGIIGGGTILTLFKGEGSSPELFGWYGVGLAAGFFGYFLVLVGLVKKSTNFDADWFLDGRRRNPADGFGYGTDVRPTMTPMSGTISTNAISPTSNTGTVQNFYLVPEKAKASASVEPLVEWDLLSNVRPRNERVAEAKRLLAEGKVYPRGCSEFVSAVLGVPYEVANDLMGAAPTSVGSRPPYPSLTPGDIAGWTNAAGMGHVTVYIGESDAIAFIDVREPGARPRSKNGFYDRELFKSSRF